MANIDLPPVEMDRRNQPIFVTPDVEHHPLADFIGGGEGRAECTKILKIGMLHNLEPSRQRRFAIRVLFPKLAQGFSGNDVHDTSLSQDEILGKVSNLWRGTAQRLGFTRWRGCRPERNDYLVTDGKLPPQEQR